jgi:hypothetical protein
MIEESIGRLSIRELIVDFFGSLVPGLIFVTCAVVVVAWPLVSALQLTLTLLGAERPISELYADIARLTDAARVELTILLVMVAYVAGHLFYRQDPKVPDERSFKRTVTKTDDWVADADNCEFPYPHFDRYLRSRGLTHLLELTEWCESGRRTKNFINILKIRLFCEHPEKCGSVAKNEAHVRLMASTWYMSRALKYLGVAVTIVSLVTAIASMRGAWSSAAFRTGLLHIIPASPALVVLLVAVAAQRVIERFLHYQRVREVMWVLETAYVAYRDTPHKLRDICPRFGAANPSVLDGTLASA